MTVRGDLVYVKGHWDWGYAIILKLCPIEDTRSSTEWAAYLQWFTCHPDRPLAMWINIDKLEEV
jgi:hypothetical protein